MAKCAEMLGLLVVLLCAFSGQITASVAPSTGQEAEGAATLYQLFPPLPVSPTASEGTGTSPSPATPTDTKKKHKKKSAPPPPPPPPAGKTKDKKAKKKTKDKNGGNAPGPAPAPPPCQCLQDSTCIDSQAFLRYQQNEAAFLAFQATQSRNQLLISLVQELMNNTLGDTPKAIIASGGQQLQHLLDQDVRVRLSPAGDFNGFDAAFEYFYGFVSQPGTLVGQFVDYKALTVGDNRVGLKANLNLNNLRAALTGGHPPANFNLTVFGFFTFNDDNKIASMDMSVPNLGELLDPDPGQDDLKQSRIQQICAVMTQPIPNTPFPNGTCFALQTWGPPTLSNDERTGACIAFMNTIPYGTGYRFNMNSFECRLLHTTLTLFNPQVHCPHAGPTGGGTCIDHTYESYYQEGDY